MLKEGRIDVTSMILDSPQNPLGLGLKSFRPRASESKVPSIPPE